MSKSPVAASPVALAPDFDGPRACAWPRRLVQGPARLVAPEEFRAWVLHEDERLLVVDKPGDVVCHPSKHGPRSSLIGAAREHTGQETLHLVFRLDRETSGVVVFAKDPRTAGRLQTAMQDRRIGKGYLAILGGELAAPVTVDQRLGDDTSSPVFIKTGVVPDGRAAVTHFEPVAAAGGFILARVRTETGRKHQIRAHAQWLGHALVGDKIYGPDARCYLDFIDQGWTAELAAKLLLPRQALHCSWIDLRAAGLPETFAAPLAPDLRSFCVEHGFAPEVLAAAEVWPESPLASAGPPRA